MLEHYYLSDGATLDRLRRQPLGPYLDSYLSSLECAGYAPTSIRSKLGLLSHLSRWLAREDVAASGLTERCLEALLDERRREDRLHRSDPTTARHLLGYLRREGVAPFPGCDCRPSALNSLLGQFEQYLRVERGLTSTTVANYQPYLSRFLVDRFGEGPLQLGELRPSDISNFILRHAKSQSSGRAKLMVTALRSSFRFLFQHGKIELDLAASVPSVAHWSNSSVPKYLNPQEVESILAACDRRTLIGRRDHSILLLLARLGLRGGEVVALELDDVDWRAGELAISGKGLRRDRLPLPHDVGDALASYVRRDRPKSPTRRLFIRARAPRRGLGGPATVSTIVRRAIERAGLCPPVKGAHLLRHSLATGMLRRGASMAEIGQILRHRAAATTEIYAKVDLDGLRSLAQPWPGLGGVR